MATKNIELVENDLLPYLNVEWSGQDITSYTIELHVRYEDGTKITRSAVVDDYNVGGAGTALFHFEWQAGDLITGTHTAEIEATNPSAENETWQGLRLIITEEIA